jgi:hypothetical protein
MPPRVIVTAHAGAGAGSKLAADIALALNRSLQGPIANAFCSSDRLVFLAVCPTLACLPCYVPVFRVLMFAVGRHQL